MTINQAAPVVSRAEIEVGADVQTVWDVVTRVADWPSWNPEVKSVSVDGELTAGSRFCWRAGPGTISSRVEEIDAPRYIAWSGRTFGIKAIHAHQLEPVDGSTIVLTEESYEGMPVRLFRGRMQSMLDAALDSGLTALKTEAERRTSDG
jgi:hypothetical protein